MSFLDKLDRKFGHLGIPNISLYLVIGQVFVLLATLLGRLDPSILVLVPSLVLEGQWWRVVTFLFIPPSPGFFGYLFVAFAWYIFHLMGSALESYWGVFRYNFFLLLGMILTIGAAFLAPNDIATNTFIAGSVFLAFAYLNPDFELSLFFILPLKIKWLAMITWVLYAVSFFRGDWGTRWQILASVGNFLFFFGADIWRSMGQRRRTMVRDIKKAEVVEDVPRHRCHVCGKTDRSHPQLDFRYCSKCAGDQCYCPEHIQNHAHVVAADDKKPA